MKYLLFLMILATTACVEKAAPTDPRSRQDHWVSIVQLLSNPEDFDGKPVRVVGYLQMEHETYALWLHKEDRIHALLPNRIDLEASACSSQLEHVNESYVLLEGTFSIIDKGTSRKRHLLTSVTRCQGWNSGK